MAPTPPPESWASLAHNGASNLYRAVTALASSNPQSVAQRVSQQAAAISRVYVSEAIADDEIIIPIIGTCTELYIAYIMTALGLESYVSDTRKVGDITRMVSTESLVDPVTLAKSAFGQTLGSTEDLDDLADDLRKKISTLWNEKAPDKSTSKDHKGLHDTQLAKLTDKEQRLVTGRLIDMGITTESGGTAQLRVLVQLIPRLIQNKVAEAFLSLNTKSDAKRRLLQLRTGQIKFWRDFVFAIDRIQKVKEALKADDSGALQDMLAKQSNSLRKYWASLTRLDDNYNSASSVLIVTKDQFEQELANAGITFDAKNQARFFSTSYMMFLVVVDQDHALVDIYTHGIKGHGTYSFSIIDKVGSGKSSGMDIKDVMTVLGHGNVARF